MAEHTDRVGVAAEHHVTEADVVVGREVGGHDAREHALAVQLDIVQRLERQREVAQQAVHPQQADQREVAQHAVQPTRAVLARHRVGVLAALHRCKLLRDVRALDQRVEHVQHRVAAPGVWVLSKQQSVFGRGVGARDAVAVPAEGLELVDELVDDVPGPEGLRPVLVVESLGIYGVTSTYRRDVDVHRPVGVEDEVEEVAVVVVARELDLQRRLVLQWSRGRHQTGLHIRHPAHRAAALGRAIHAVVEPNLLAVVIDHGLLVLLRGVVDNALGGLALVGRLLVQRHGGAFLCAASLYGEVKAASDIAGRVKVLGALPKTQPYCLILALATDKGSALSRQNWTPVCLL